MSKILSTQFIFKRVQGRPVFLGVKHEVVRHSPTGMEWGYGGSGPADLALNILLTLGIEPAEADALYQSFKLGFISCMPREGGVIDHARVLEWVDKMRELREQRRELADGRLL